MNWKAMAAIALTMVVAVPIGLGYILATEEEETVSWQTTGQSNISDLLLNHSTPYSGTFSGPANNSLLINSDLLLQSVDYVSTGPTVSSTPIYTASSGTVTLTAGVWTDMAQYGYFSIDNHSVRFRMTYSDGSVSYPLLTPNLVRTPEGLVYTEGTTYTNVAKLELSAANGTATVPLILMTASDSTYGNAADGWHLPASYIPGTNYATWINGQANTSITVYIELNATATNNCLSLITSTNANAVHILQNGGVVSCGVGNTDTSLGSYSALKIDISKTETTISGISAMPTMGKVPTTYNSITLHHPEAGLSKLFLSESGGYNIFRVDSTEMVMGYFPDTLDCTLDLASLYPDAMLSVKLNSIGVYGDSLQIGSTTYAVTDGSISVGGKKVALKGAMISFLSNEDGELSGSINNRDLGTFEEIPSITFGGEWSLTATAYKVEETTDTNMTWQPGGFGLDREGFAAAGLITAGGVFVMLGMTGRMSGSKALLLAVICGASAFAYFSFI